MLPGEAGPSNARGHALVAELWLACGPLVEKGEVFGKPREQLKGWLLGLAPDDQIAVLKAAVEAMPGLWTVPNREEGNRRGALLFTTAVILYYEAKLPFTEDDLCAILLLSKHRCGHGGDAVAPFELARDHLRTHGYSQHLVSALSVFASELPGSTGRTHHVKRCVAFLDVLNTDLVAVRRKRKPPWIDHVRVALADVHGKERRSWERYVLGMTVADRHDIPRNWEGHHHALIADLGPVTVLSRFETWWPVPTSTGKVSLGTSGPQLLKQFIWTLGLLRVPAGEGLVCRLADVTDWHTPKAPMAVLKPAAAYLGRSTSPEAVRAKAALECRIAADAEV